MSVEALKEIFSTVDPLEFHYPLGIREGCNYTIDEADDNDYSFLYLSTPEDCKTQLVAPFDGTLFYNSLFDTLCLSLSASANLHFRSLLDEEESSPVNMCWHLVDAESIVTAIQILAEHRDVILNTAKQEIEEFIIGNAGINVRSGDLVGTTFTNIFSMSYYEDSGVRIHALYSLWKLKQYAESGVIELSGPDEQSESDDESESHPLSSAIDSIVGDKELAISPDGNIVDSGSGDDFGPYRVMV